MAPSFAFVGEPETDGVAEASSGPFQGTGRPRPRLRTIDDVRAAARKFFELYNAQWLHREKQITQPASNAFRPGSKPP